MRKHGLINGNESTDSVMNVERPSEKAVNVHAPVSDNTFFLKAVPEYDEPQLIFPENLQRIALPPKAMTRLDGLEGSRLTRFVRYMWQLAPWERRCRFAASVLALFLILAIILVYWL